MNCQPVLCPPGVHFSCIWCRRLTQGNRMSISDHMFLFAASTTFSSGGFVVYFLQNQVKTLPHFPKHSVTGDSQQQWVNKFTDCKCLTGVIMSRVIPLRNLETIHWSHNLLYIRKSPKPLNVVLKVVTEVYIWQKDFLNPNPFLKSCQRGYGSSSAPRMDQRGHPGRDAVIHEWGWLKQAQARGVPHTQSQLSAPARKGMAGALLPNTHSSRFLLSIHKHGSNRDAASAPFLLVCSPITQHC